MKTLILSAVVILVVFALVAALPTIRINPQEVISSNAFSYVRAALYFIPSGTCAAILTIIVGLQVFRIIIALIKVIWEVLPIT